MNDQDLENLVRRLKPSSLPEDLRERLAAEPELPATPVTKRMLFIVAGVAAAVVVFAGMILLERPEPPAGSLADGDEEERPVSVVQTDSTLLGSRLLEVKEYDGQLWEISEEEWRDDTLLLYTAGPSSLNSTVIRREIVCAPLQFQ
jgi:hypothetical protein